MFKTWLVDKDWLTHILQPYSARQDPYCVNVISSLSLSLGLLFFSHTLCLYRFLSHIKVHKALFPCLSLSCSLALALSLSLSG